ncbi:hypothetical protein CRM22_001062 [Opisthorchis felineus]|uniref:Uncharacterized protein n=1 Tax=Opisthorchis felineus TaxID=147828 RepID=A0A4S2MCA1_OPIFE|nr:hypothetical protein CRM22_001062 [Opisthorchis felineus]TGZ74212.1 hypothetical protein CRM22_001062 [Opisthorchis felineus]
MFNKMKPPKPSPPESKDAEMYDLQSDIKIWAIDTFVATATKEQKKIDTNDLDLKVIWDDITVTHEPTEYFDDHRHRLPKSHSLFSTTFRNNTDFEQEYCFRTERCTRSIAEVELERGVVFSKELSFKLSLPNAILEANAGFKHDLSLNSCTRQCTEEELSWGVDTRILVAPRHSAFAEVKVAEEELTTHFRLISVLHGRIRAVFYDAAHNNAFIKYVEGDLASIIEKELSDRGSFSPSNSHVRIETKPNGSKFLKIETVGRCKFRFGVHQEVEVNQKGT